MQTVLRMPRLTGRGAGAMRRDLVGRGFTLVNTPRFFDDLFPRLKKSWTMRPFHCQRWWKYPPLAHYGGWLEQLLTEALPEEFLVLTALEFRHEPAGYVNEEVDGLHADGSYIRSVFTPYGRTTIYRDAGLERAVPCGQTLVMTAQDRARARRVPCTLHRRPGAGPERAVIVCSFEPRSVGGRGARLEHAGQSPARGTLPTCPTPVGL